MAETSITICGECCRPMIFEEGEARDMTRVEEAEIASE